MNKENEKSIILFMVGCCSDVIVLPNILLSLFCKMALLSTNIFEFLFNISNSLASRKQSKGLLNNSMAKEVGKRLILICTDKAYFKQCR